MPKTPRSPARFLSLLGIVGWSRLEPVILAALAAEAPLLLVGAHGTAKSLLLTRLAEALGLCYRHYNASLLNFDDLIGFPVPENGRLVYLQTPSTIWDAEVVFFDEVSRCRPELQNKLFPIVHERVVQGVPLERLRHRWAAMNPPPSDTERQDEAEYVGAEPLDVALADRFAFIVPVPALADLSVAEQTALLRASATSDRQPLPEASAARIRALVANVRARLSGSAPSVDTRTADYVRLLAGKLKEGGHPLSTRRAVQLARNIPAVHAALAALGAKTDAEDTCYCAVRYSMPDAAWGRPVKGPALLAAHRAAWEVAGLEEGSDLKAILSEPSPVARMGLALASPCLHAVEVGRVIADSYASLPRVARLATAVVLMPLIGRRPDLPAPSIELIAHDYATIASVGDAQVTVRNGGHDWKREIVSRHLPRTNPYRQRGTSLTNLAIALMVGGEPFEFGTLETAYDQAVAELAGTPAEGSPCAGATP
jgi:MoxR-like ATPase